LYSQHKPNASLPRTVTVLQDSVIIHYTAGLIIADRISRKAIYETKKEVMDEVLIPAFKAAGSTAPEGLAQNAYGALRDEKKIVEML